MKSEKPNIATPGRIVSMDQFRGYTVTGMFLVNFIGDLKAMPAVLMHHGTYFSYADSIMPSFLFAVGFSYRLTILKRLPTLGVAQTYYTYFRRSLALILISLMAYGFNVRDHFQSFDVFNPHEVWEFLARLIKADLWETLAVIAVAQIVIMPVIAAGPRARVAYLLGCLSLHTLLSYAFNFNFVHAQPNWLDQYWGAADTRCWESGPFGILSWSVAMLAGSLAYDIYVSSTNTGRAAGRLLFWGAAFMLVGYSLSCLTTLYDREPGSASGENQFAESPVLPPIGNAASRDYRSLLAEPPFVPPPDVSVRPKNYWMMTKQLPSPSFILFASGFALAVYALFVLLCDVGSLRIGLFRTFGQNPLAAYLIHGVLAHNIRPLIPDDSPIWYCLVGVGAFIGVTYLFVRSLEKQNIYIRM